MLHNVNNYQLQRFHSGSSPLCSKPCENSYKPHMLKNYSSLATFLSLTVKAHIHAVTHGQLRKPQVPQHTYHKRAVRPAYFNLNRTLKVIQGHSYWCQQKSIKG